ncbi:MAG: lipoyl(octanoyl) transferase LipB [Proteobacteria bacterium]|nr:lipoyl(octanoyl) transferase LipB [Pseudomonadota bacterium]
MKTRYRGLQDYILLWREMQDFTDNRDETTPDEIWFTEHPPVFTMGLNASDKHLLAPGDIPVVQVDRGGQVTYHGPGQLMIYPLIDLRRSKIGIRKLVTALELSVVDFVAEHGVSAAARPDAPGVYVENTKLASVGLRIRRGSSFHGMALNVDIDLEPFQRINPCGYEELEMTDLHRQGIDVGLEATSKKLLPHFLRHLGLPTE